jgi:Ca2+-binding RTX toxin-like protein
VIATALVLVCSTPAAAATVGVASAGTPPFRNDTLTFVAGPGEANDVTITSPAGDRYVVHDGGATLTAGAGCTSTDAQTVACRVYQVGRTWVRVRLGDGDDSASARTATVLNAFLYGQAGNDVLEGAARAAPGWLAGGPGDDTLRAGPGGDELFGGPGADVMASPFGGQSYAVYSNRARGVRVDLNGLADDGYPDERDNVGVDVRQVSGGHGADVLVGNSRRQLFYGGEGDDVIRGLGGDDLLNGYLGDDLLVGGSGADLLEGGLGNDRLAGGQGPDRLEGAGGHDVLKGGPGRDLLYGGPQADRYFTRDGTRDRLTDGSRGVDRAWVDARLDRVSGIDRVFAG